jgi:predicted Rossmann fold nucleotide-binding protein DprA/Smf involved in DNA uptake
MKSTNIFYAGIGARETPDDVLHLMYLLGRKLATDGYVLRSGHADGADLAFEKGCDSVNGRKEIFQTIHT